MTAAGKIVHIAAVVDERGNTSALCFAPEYRPIDSEREGWTSRADEVTCPACRSASARLASVAGPHKRRRAPADEREAAYVNGARFSWAMMLQQCLINLGYDSPEAAQAKWILEREQTLHRLRVLCAKLGDNDWPEDLHLGDIVERHLVDHLRGAQTSGDNLFLAVYDSVSGMAELNNVGVVSAPDAKAARTKAAALFQTTAGSKIHITRMTELQDGWSYYT